VYLEMWRGCADNHGVRMMRDGDGGELDMVGRVGG
jgi:hypothetical protein